MNHNSHGEIIDEASNWIVGGGIVTMALFPLALPGIILAVAAAIPLVAVALAIALAAGAIVAPVWLIRLLARKMVGLRHRERPDSELLRVRPATEGRG